MFALISFQLSLSFSQTLRIPQSALTCLDNLDLLQASPAQPDAPLSAALLQQNQTFLGAPRLACGLALRSDLQADTLRVFRGEELVGELPVSTFAPFTATRELGVPGDTAPLAFQERVLAARGRWLAIGLPGAGRVAVFERTAGVWRAAQMLGGPETDLSRFGLSVAVSADFLFVAEPEHFVDLRIVEVVHVFALAGGHWEPSQVLVSPNTEPHTGFGYRLAFDRGVLAVAAPHSAAGGTPHAGRVFLFREAGGAFAASDAVEASEPTARGSFGDSLSLSAGLLAASSASGRVELFRDGGDAFLALSTLALSPGSATVLLADGRLFVGHPDSARVSVFDLSAGAPVPSYTLRGASGSRFGAALAAGGGLLAVGADTESTDAPFAGAVSIYASAQDKSWQLLRTIQGDSAHAMLGTSLATDGFSVFAASKNPSKGGGFIIEIHHQEPARTAGASPGLAAAHIDVSNVDDGKSKRNLSARTTTIGDSKYILNIHPAIEEPSVSQEYAFTLYHLSTGHCDFAVYAGWCWEELLEVTPDGEIFKTNIATPDKPGRYEFCVQIGAYTHVEPVFITKHVKPTCKNGNVEVKQGIGSVIDVYLFDSNDDLITDGREVFIGESMKTMKRTQYNAQTGGYFINFFSESTAMTQELTVYALGTQNVVEEIATFEVFFVDSTREISYVNEFDASDTSYSVRLKDYSASFYPASFFEISNWQLSKSMLDASLMEGTYSFSFGQTYVSDDLTISFFSETDQGTTFKFLDRIHTVFGAGSEVAIDHTHFVSSEHVLLSFYLLDKHTITITDGREVKVGRSSSSNSASEASFSQELGVYTFDFKPTGVPTETLYVFEFQDNNAFSFVDAFEVFIEDEEVLVSAILDNTLPDVSSSFSVQTVSEAAPFNYNAPFETMWKQTKPVFGESSDFLAAMQLSTEPSPYMSLAVTAKEFPALSPATFDFSLFSPFAPKSVELVGSVTPCDGWLQAALRLLDTTGATVLDRRLVKAGRDEASAASLRFDDASGCYLLRYPFAGSTVLEEELRVFSVDGGGDLIEIDPFTLSYTRVVDSFFVAGTHARRILTEHQVTLSRADHAFFLFNKKGWPRSFPQRLHDLQNNITISLDNSSSRSGAMTLHLSDGGTTLERTFSVSFAQASAQNVSVVSYELSASGVAALSFQLFDTDGLLVQDGRDVSISTVSASSILLAVALDPRTATYSYYGFGAEDGEMVSVFERTPLNEFRYVGALDTTGLGARVHAAVFADASDPGKTHGFAVSSGDDAPALPHAARAMAAAWGRGEPLFASASERRGYTLVLPAVSGRSAVTLGLSTAPSSAGALDSTHTFAIGACGGEPATFAFDGEAATLTLLDATLSPVTDGRPVKVGPSEALACVLPFDEEAGLYRVDHPLLTGALSPSSASVELEVITESPRGTLLSLGVVAVLQRDQPTTIRYAFVSDAVPLTSFHAAVSAQSAGLFPASMYHNTLGKPVLSGSTRRLYEHVLSASPGLPQANALYIEAAAGDGVVGQLVHVKLVQRALARMSVTPSHGRLGETVDLAVRLFDDQGALVSGQHSVRVVGPSGRAAPAAFCAETGTYRLAHTLVTDDKTEVLTVIAQGAVADTYISISHMITILDNVGTCLFQTRNAMPDMCASYALRILDSVHEATLADAAPAMWTVGLPVFGTNIPGSYAVDIPADALAANNSVTVSAESASGHFYEFRQTVPYSFSEVLALSASPDAAETNSVVVFTLVLWDGASVLVDDTLTVTASVGDGQPAAASYNAADGSFSVALQTPSTAGPADLRVAVSGISVTSTSIVLTQAVAFSQRCEGVSLVAGEFVAGGETDVGLVLVDANGDTVSDERAVALGWEGGAQAAATFDAQSRAYTAALAIPTYEGAYSLEVTVDGAAFVVPVGVEIGTPQTFQVTPASVVLGQKATFTVAVLNQHGSPLLVESDVAIGLDDVNTTSVSINTAGRFFVYNASVPESWDGLLRVDYLGGRYNLEVARETLPEVDYGFLATGGEVALIVCLAVVALGAGGFLFFLLVLKRKRPAVSARVDNSRDEQFKEPEPAIASEEDFANSVRIEFPEYLNASRSVIEHSSAHSIVQLSSDPPPKPTSTTSSSSSHLPSLLSGPSSRRPARTLNAFSRGISFKNNSWGSAAENDLVYFQ